MKTLSVKQPYAYLICAGIKPIENRTWKCPEKYIGKRVLIHASGKPANIQLEIEGQATAQEIEMLSALNYAEENELFSAIIGSVEIVDYIINHPSIWAEKTPYLVNPAGRPIKPIYNWVLANPVLFDKPILNVKGRLGFWDYPIVDKEKQCPEIPYFGATYPDATCIDGYLWDLDSHEDGKGFTQGGDAPCPFCNTETWLENSWLIEEGNTIESGLIWIEKMRERYDSKS